MKILVADDDRDMVDLLTYWLRGYGHDILRAFDGEQAITRWREDNPDLVILDVEMPRLDGFEVCQRMTVESNALVLMLTCRDAEVDEIRALALGADDYIHKPFSPRRLLAHIQALTRRTADAELATNNTAISRGPISLDTMRHEVTSYGKQVRLTPTESRLLHLLLTHIGQVLPTDIIIERVWGFDATGDTNLVKTHIHHLRRKVESNPNEPQHIITVPGVGYTYAAEQNAAVHV